MGALVVSTDGSTIDGIISERDVVRALASHGVSTLGRSVSTAMSGHVVTCEMSDSVDELEVFYGNFERVRTTRPRPRDSDDDSESDDSDRG